LSDAISQCRYFSVFVADLGTCPDGLIFVHGLMQFHEIQAQIAVADVKGGAGLEIIVADMGGNLVLVDIEGEVGKWLSRNTAAILSEKTQMLVRFYGMPSYRVCCLTLRR
jgi:hypothetical protein